MQSHHLRGKDPSDSTQHYRYLNFMSFFEPNQPQPQQQQDNIFAVRAEIAVEAPTASPTPSISMESMVPSVLDRLEDGTSLPTSDESNMPSTSNTLTMPPSEGTSAVPSVSPWPSEGPSQSIEPSPVLASNMPTESTDVTMFPSEGTSAMPSVSPWPSEGPSQSIEPSPVLASNMPTESTDVTMFPSERTSAMPSVSPWPSEGPSQSIEPSYEPSMTPNPTSTPMPTDFPSVTPTGVPSLSLQPSDKPSVSQNPTITPMPSASQVPTGVPSISPRPSPAESNEPGAEPTEQPSTTSPTNDPSSVPSSTPTLSTRPSAQPSVSLNPTMTPMPTSSVAPSSNPTESSAPSPFPTISLPPSFKDERAVASGTYGDPHIITWDNFEFDCQAAGEFTMVKALTGPVNFEVQERFTAVSNACNASASVSTGFVVQADGIPNVQVSIPRNDPNPTLILGGCPIDFRSNGELLDSSLLTPSIDAFGANITLNKSNPGGGQVVVEYPSGLAFIATLRNSQEFGCFFRMQIILPPVYSAETTCWTSRYAQPQW